MKIKKKIISGLLTATTLVSLCAFSAGAVSTDKKFSVEDATLIQKNVVGMTTFDEKQIKLYDLNKDGVITVVDSTLVQKIIVGLIKEPTEEQPTTAESTTEPTTEAVTEPTTVPKPTTVPTGIKLNKTDIVLGTTESYALSTTVTNGNLSQVTFATVYKGNIIKNLIMDCQSYTKYRPNETTGGIFVSWRRKEEPPTGA